MTLAEFATAYATDITGWLVLLDVALVLGTLCAVLHFKREAQAAIAWVLLIVLVPFGGAVTFWLFGYQTVNRRLRRKQVRSLAYKKLAARAGRAPADVPPRWDVLARLGHHGDGFPVTGGNVVTLYHDGTDAYRAMLEAIEGAKHHVHAQFFIVKSDETGRRFVEALRACARRGVQVRLLVDAVGSYKLSSRVLAELTRDGGKVANFLPLWNPLRVNLRNHRKILVVDGRVGFSGGLNVADEYIHKNPKFGYWRDTHFRLAGPAVNGLQDTMLEDWYFATQEAVTGDAYFPHIDPCGRALAQVVSSGPDDDFKAIRETYVSAILRARERVWVASPYFVPDAGLRDALVIAARSGLDVRFLGLFRPDKWLPYLAARYFYADVLAAGAKVYQYTRGMMHSKYVLVDGEFASVGSANTDNRSLLLNFELNCQFFDTGIAREMEGAFLNDLKDSIRIDPARFAERPLVSRLAENAARLFAPVL